MEYLISKHTEGSMYEQNKRAQFTAFINNFLIKIDISDFYFVCERPNPELLIQKVENINLLIKITARKLS